MRLSLAKKRIIAWILVWVMVLGVLPLDQFTRDVYADDTVELTVKIDWQDYGFTSPRPDIVGATLTTLAGDLIADNIILSADSSWEATYSVDAYTYESGDYKWTLGDVNRYLTSDPVTDGQETVFTVVPENTALKLGLVSANFDNEPDQFMFNKYELAAGKADRWQISLAAPNVYDVVSSDPEVLRVVKVEIAGNPYWYLVPQEKSGKVTVSAYDDEYKTNTANIDVTVMADRDNVYTVYDGSDNVTIGFDDENNICTLTEIKSTDSRDVANVYVPGKIYHKNDTYDTYQYYDVVLGSPQALENPTANKMSIDDVDNIIFGEGVKADKNMDYVFTQAQCLTDIDLSNVDFSETESMAGMFLGCDFLSKVNFGKKTISNVTDMTSMFSGCTSLEKIDLGCFYTASLEKMSNMFEGCSALSKIKAGTGFVTDSVTEGADVFKNCTSLVGGEGTRYDENNIDYTYAKMDGGNADPGT